MTNDKKMYKVLLPLDKKGGGTYWMRLGTGFTNRDNSINVYLDAFPPTNSKSGRFELQIREIDEEDRRRREQGTSQSPPPYGYGASTNNDSRAVTAAGGSAAAEPGDVPF